jgi:hypothetical protein
MELIKGGQDGLGPAVFRQAAREARDVGR